jgi:hypothetical protein
MRVCSKPGQFPQQRLRLFELRKEFLVRLELGRVDAPAGAAVIYRIVQVQHLVVHHIFEREARGARVVEDAADDDHVVRWIEVAEPRPRAHMAPAERGARHHTPEVFRVELLEYLFQIVY